MTVALLLNVEAGIGRHIWDLTYPRVMAIGRWSKRTAVCEFQKTLTVNSLHRYHFLGLRTTSAQVQHPLPIPPHLPQRMA
jgi:hypothetical protein